MLTSSQPRSTVWPTTWHAKVDAGPPASSQKYADGPDIERLPQMATQARTPDERRDPTIEAATALRIRLDSDMHLFEGGPAVYMVLWAWLNDEQIPAAGDLWEAVELLAALDHPSYFQRIPKDEGQSDSVELITRRCTDILKQCHRALIDNQTDNRPYGPGGDLAFAVRYARIAAIESAYDDLGRAIGLLKADAAANGD